MTSPLTTPQWRQRFDQWLSVVAAGDQRGLIALSLYTNLAVYLSLALAAPSSVASTIYGMGAVSLWVLRTLNVRAWAAPATLAWMAWVAMHAVITSAVVWQDGVWTLSALFYLSTPLPMLLVLGLRPALWVVALNGLTWLGLSQFELNGWLPTPLREPTDLYWPLLLYVGLTFSLSVMPLVAYFIQRKLSEQLSERNALLIRTQANLREQRAQQEQFVASVSHELRTPMNAILGFLQAVDPRWVNDPQDQEMVDHMSNSAQQLLRIINDLLDFSQLEAKRLRLQPRAFDVHALVRQVLATYSAELQAKGVALTVDLHDDHAWVWGDPERVGQALHKLLANASKFTPRGEVSLRVWRASPTTLHFAVRDSGRGIQGPELERVFSRLSRLTSRTRRDMGGTGLGLPIAQALAGLMGGHISVRSQLGTGSTFTLALPLPQVAPASELNTPSATHEPSAAQTCARVLIVDDSPVNRLVAQHLLQSDFSQLTILQADGADAALAMIHEHAIDLVLMDVVMPEVDGIEATRRILASGAACLPWVLGLTADTSDDVVQRCLSAGMRDVLAKPFDRQQLALSVAQHLRQKQSLQV
jgi:signal transduction histidine kinase